MLHRIGRWRFSPSETLGGVLVFIGLTLFVVVFLAVFPVLRDPVGTYDRWFPEDESSEPTAESEAEEVPDPESPVAAFRYVVETTIEGGEGGEGGESGEPGERISEFRVSLEDRSEPGDSDIATWMWDLGDGTEADGSNIDHTYEGPGVYPVRLEVVDDNGESSAVEGEVEVPEEGRAFGRFEAEEGLDLSGIESAAEDAIATLETSIDDTLDSFASASRSVAIMVLFGLAAIATTVVAWRVTRAGVMLLGPAQKMRLNVKAADIRVDTGKTEVEDAAAAKSPITEDGATEPENP